MLPFGLSALKTLVVCVVVSVI